MRIVLCLAVFIAACGGPEESPAEDAGVETTDAAQPVVQSKKNPLKVTWGMTTQEVLDVGGRPDDIRPLMPPTDPIYGDTVWRWDLPCGPWFVTFDHGIVTARFGWARGCEPEP